MPEVGLGQVNRKKFLLLHLEQSYQRRQWHPTPVLLPGKSHGWRRLVGCSPWDHKKSDTTKWLHFHFSLACIGQGNGNPLQCSCLENPRDGGAWWAAVCGVAQSRTRLKRLSSSSSSSSSRTVPCTEWVPALRCVGKKVNRFCAYLQGWLKYKMDFLKHLKKLKNSNFF